MSVTDQRSAAELEATVAALEQLLEVQERTVVEQSTKLARQARELKRSNEELERFAYVISHDLQEPLRMVSSYTQLLADRYSDRLDETALRYIDYAVGGAKRMQQLINDLLLLSRVATKARPAEPTALGPLVDTVREDLAVLLDESGARLDVEPLPMVLADRSQVRQLFQNLLANAIHHRRDDEAPEVRIAAARDDGFWRISVADRGPGIDPRFHDRIFVMFQRLDRKRREGTGLGLALCKKIVERHGGRIWVESAPDQGATFHFTLPAAEATEEPR